MTIQPGQIYRSCKPSANGFRIRIISVGSLSARAVDASNGRPLLYRVQLSNLHDSATTKTGQPRRAGYALEQS